MADSLEELHLSKCFTLMAQYNREHNLGLDLISDEAHNNVASGQSIRLLNLLGDDFAETDNGKLTSRRWHHLMENYIGVINAINGPHGLTVLRALLVRYHERRLNEEAKGVAPGL